MKEGISRFLILPGCPLFLIIWDLLKELQFVR